MKTSTPLPAPHVAPFVATALAQVEGALSIGEARLMVGHRDPHDGVRAEVPRGLPLRCRHRLRSLLEDYAPTIPSRANDQHTLAGRSWAAVSNTSARKARG
ncbi:hypothetical protein [Bradyrhizobium barranii]